MSRQIRYSGLSDELHFRQLDLDMDGVEDELRSFKREIRTGLDNLRNDFNDGQQKSSRMSIAILSSLVVASILMVINIIALGAGG